MPSKSFAIVTDKYLEGKIFWKLLLHLYYVSRHTCTSGLFFILFVKLFENIFWRTVFRDIRIFGYKDCLSSNSIFKNNNIAPKRLDSGKRISDCLLINYSRKIPHVNSTKQLSIKYQSPKKQASQINKTKSTRI